MKQFTLIGKLISVNGRKVNRLLKGGEVAILRRVTVCRVGHPV